MYYIILKAAPSPPTPFICFFLFTITESSQLEISGNAFAYKCTSMYLYA